MGNKYLKIEGDEKLLLTTVNSKWLIGGGRGRSVVKSEDEDVFFIKYWFYFHLISARHLARMDWFVKVYLEIKYSNEYLAIISFNHIAI